MTNKPMLSVERELLDRAVNGGRHEHREAIAELRQMLRDSLDKPAAQHQGEPVAWMACGQLFKTVMGARNYAGSLSITPLYAEQPAPVSLTVWYGSMPESNGKTNWTAILHRKGDGAFPLRDIADGITIDRSEYPDRVRYEADRMRYLIGELLEEPDILDYDDKLHSGYVYPHKPAPIAVVMPERKGLTHKNWRDWTYEEIGYNKGLDDVARLNLVKP